MTDADDFRRAIFGASVRPEATVEPEPPSRSPSHCPRCSRVLIDAWCCVHGTIEVAPRQAPVPADLDLGFRRRSRWR